MEAVIAVRRPEKMPKKYSLDEYIRLENRATEKHEFYNGQIVKMGNAKFKHNLIAANTARAIGNALAELPKKYLVLGDGQKIYIERANIAVYPDALVVFEKPQFFQGRQEFLTNPLLIVEVLSRSTAAYDKIGKFDHYRLLPSFKEYVLIDSRKTEVETRFREEEDLWRMRTTTGEKASIALRSVGVEISLEAIYADVEFEGE